MKAFFLAMQMLTILPTPSYQEVSQEELRQSVLFYPLIGLLQGAVLWGTQWLLAPHMTVMARVWIGLALYTVMTGALHLDGWMDTADAIGSRAPKEKALLIMKDSRVGAIGVVAGVLLILGKFVALMGLPVSSWASYLVVPMLSRYAMNLSMHVAKSAKEEGLGAIFAGKIPIRITLCSGMITYGITFLLFPWRDALLLIVLQIVATVVFTRMMQRRFGGMTGDTYGALQEGLEFFLWFIAL